MQEQQVSAGYDRGSFFGRAPRARSTSDSSGLSIIQFFWGLSLLNVAKALNIPNPFIFIQNNTFFSLFTNPLVNADDHYIGWSAYASLVDAVAHGEAGNITQMPGNYYLPTLEWFVAACDLDIKLNTNGTEAQALPFLEVFNKLVANDTALFDARSRSHEECQHYSNGEIAMSALFTLLMVILIVFAVRCACLAICHRERRYYESIADAPQAPPYSALRPQLATAPPTAAATETPGASKWTDEVDSDEDEERALKAKR